MFSLSSVFSASTSNTFIFSRSVLLSLFALFSCVRSDISFACRVDTSLASSFTFSVDSRSVVIHPVMVDSLHFEHATYTPEHLFMSGFSFEIGRSLHVSHTHTPHALHFISASSVSFVQLANSHFFFFALVRNCSSPSFLLNFGCADDTLFRFSFSAFISSRCAASISSVFLVYSFVLTFRSLYRVLKSRVPVDDLLLPSTGVTGLLTIGECVVSGAASSSFTLIVCLLFVCGSGAGSGSSPIVSMVVMRGRGYILGFFRQFSGIFWMFSSRSCG